MLDRMRSFHALARGAGLIALLVLTIPTHAAGINDTGITTCSNATQNGLPCPVAGFPRQDAEFGTNGFNFTKLDAAGNDLPASATDHTCVRDNVTGLIWQVKLSDSYYTFDQAATYTGTVNTTGLCGFNDWRMPNIKELLGIADHGKTDPAIDTNYFPNTPNSWFWSGSPLAINSSSAWNVYFGEGYASNDGRDGYLRVRLVRGGQSFDSFADNNDGTVSQTNTGLMWAKCSEGQTGTNCAGIAKTMNWSTALTAANNSNLGGYNDWRLPNVKELQALVDYSRNIPVINTSYFPNTPSSWFWSGSPFANYANHAWFVSFNYGNASEGHRDDHYPVRLVRNGAAVVNSSFGLIVNKAGSGDGSMTSNDGKLNCEPVTCLAVSTTLNSGTVVILSATAASGSTFTGWSGGGCSGTGSCTVTMNAAQTVTANFAPASYSLSINKSGNGLIYSDDYKINCGSTCSADFNSGIIVNLNTTSDAGYVFSNWSNGCTGSGACSILMNSAKAVLATFNPAPTYAIGLVANPSAGGSVTCSVNPVIQGGSTNCTATPNNGYTFTGFGGDCYGTYCSLNNVTSNKTVTANFTAITYPINATANPSIGGNVSCSVNPVTYGGSSNCTATANTGYTFTGFGGDCSGTYCSLNNVTSNKTVTANFTAIGYPINVTTNPSIGGSVNCSVNPVTYGGSSNCAATANTGYTFTGFGGDCSGTSCSLTNVTATKTVTANFTAITYPINATANPSIGGSVSCSVNPVTYGGSSNCAATANTGYTFTGFGGDCSGTSCSLTNFISNKTVTANFTAITYPINATANPSTGGSVNCSVNPVTYGGSSNCTATPKTGYNFTGFSGDCSGTSCSLTNITATKTVTANFTAIGYPINVTANPSIGGSVNCSVNPVVYGGSSNCTATPKTGYNFSGFSGDCSGTSCSLTNITATKTVTANFTAIGYPINATTNPSIGGSVNCSVNPVTYGGSSNCTATANTGYTFTGFSGDCYGTSCSLTNVTANKTVTANFTAITYPINATANPSLGGSVNCSVNPVTYGGSSNCTATPNAGYNFIGFSGDCSGTSCALTNVTGNKTVTANFGLTADYVLNIIQKGTGSGAVTTADGKINCGTDCHESYTSGQSVTLKAIADVGAVFAGWSGACTGTNTCTVSMNAMKNVTATFTATALDLTITNMVITPASPMADNLFDIAVTIKNFSKKALEAGDLTIWKNQATIGTCGALGNARTGVGSLAAGASRVLTVRLQTPDVGTYTARAFIDSRCITTEINETDNQMTQTYTVK